VARPTIQDVADLAGVSKATVSAVLNDKSTVNERTREEVLDAMRRLSYRPRPGARGRLHTEGPRSIAFVQREIANPYFSEVVAGAESYLRERGYVLLVAASEGDFRAEQRIIRLFTLRDVDGILLTPVLDDETDLSHIFDMKRRNISFVLLEEIRGIQANLVDVDNVEGAKAAARVCIPVRAKALRCFSRGPNPACSWATAKHALCLDGAPSSRGSGCTPFCTTTRAGRRVAPRAPPTSPRTRRRRDHARAGAGTYPATSPRTQEGAPGEPGFPRDLSQSRRSVWLSATRPPSSARSSPTVP